MTMIAMCEHGAIRFSHHILGGVAQLNMLDRRNLPISANYSFAGYFYLPYEDGSPGLPIVACGMVPYEVFTKLAANPLLAAFLPALLNLAKDSVGNLPFSLVA